MRLTILGLGFIFLFFSCDEIGPTIDLQSPQRKVLVEEFTGNLCVNCPDGAERLENLLDIHGENLIVVSIHSGFFSMPHSTSDQDFRTEEGEALEALIGPVTAYPSASINRRLFSGESSRIVFSGTWPGYILQELSRESPVELSLGTSYSPAERQLQVEVDLIFFEALQDPANLTVYLLETDIPDSQITPEGLKEDYIHRHVLRSALTPFSGTPISDTDISTQAQRFTFAANIPQEWILNNMSVVAFVHAPSPNLDVFQVESLKLIE